jgi:hypothetical protein
LLVLASLPVFLLVDLLLWLAIPGLPGALTMLGSAMLLSGFSALIVCGLLGILKSIACTILDYFSLKQRVQRRLWFVQDQQEQLKRQFYYQTKQIKYFNEFSRKRLLKLNNLKHLQSLSRSINHQLLSLKPKVSQQIYLQLQHDHVRYRKQQDIEALLILQQKISTLV